MSIETRLRAARTRLVLDRPFIGALVLHLPIVEADWCETVATDARAFYFNPAYVARLSQAEVQFVLAHEAMHCALCHFARRGHRTKRRWDVACDYAVNMLLVDEGLQPPKGALVDARYRGLSAEEIYPLIDPDTHERTLDSHAFEPGRAAEQPGLDRSPGPPDRSTATEHGDDRPQGPTSDDDSWSDAAPHARRNEGRAGAGPQMPPADDRLAQDWRMRMASAAQQARRAGRLGACWERLVERLIEPRLEWRSLLARFLASVARDDYSFQRASRRDGDALLPTLQSRQIDLCVALDTSGSIGETELAAFAAEIDALKGQVRARITLHACDDQLAPAGPWVFQPWQPVDLPERLPGGGGTDFRPVFEWIEQEGLRPDLLLYFTDAEGDFPGSPPPYPVVWLVKGAADVPWGERIQFGS